MRLAIFTIVFALCCSNSLPGHNVKRNLSMWLKRDYAFQQDTTRKKAKKKAKKAETDPGANDPAHLPPHTHRPPRDTTKNHH